MVKIQIEPAHGGNSGYLKANGHAGSDLLCNTITAICECLAVNLKDCWDVKLLRRDQPGDYSLRWSQTARRSKGIDRANQAAGFAYNGLKALEAEYPQALEVEWKKGEAQRW